MLRVETCSTPASFSPRSTGLEISDLCPTLMQRLPGAAMTLVSELAPLMIVGTIPNRRPSSMNVSASSGSQPTTVIPSGVTASIVGGCWTC